MRKRSQRGSATVEVALMVPWILFLFVGILDFGFYSYSAISTQNAARAAAIRIANSQHSFSWNEACIAAYNELRGLSNMVGVTQNNCQASPATISDSNPYAVRIFKLCAAGSSDPTCDPTLICADCNLAGNTDAQSVRAEVTYRTQPMIPIPGIMMGRMQLSRFGEARIHVR